MTQPEMKDFGQFLWGPLFLCVWDVKISLVLNSTRVFNVSVRVSCLLWWRLRWWLAPDVLFYPSVSFQRRSIAQRRPDARFNISHMDSHEGWSSPQLQKGEEETLGPRWHAEWLRRSNFFGNYVPFDGSPIRLNIHNHSIHSNPTDRVGKLGWS